MTARHPVQPLVTDSAGRVMFKPNAIVQFLLNAGPFDENMLLLMPWSNEDRVQLAQLLGVSLGGFAYLPYITDDDFNRAKAQQIEELWNGADAV